MCLFLDTIGGQNLAPVVEFGTLSHYLRSVVLHPRARISEAQELMCEKKRRPIRFLEYIAKTGEGCHWSMLAKGCVFAGTC